MLSRSFDRPVAPDDDVPSSRHRRLFLVVMRPAARLTSEPEPMKRLLPIRQTPLKVLFHSDAVV